MNALLACRDAIHAALVAEMSRRRERPRLEWIAAERQVVADAATVWAARHDRPATVTAADVEAVEGLPCTREGCEGDPHAETRVEITRRVREAAA